jgi:hypothetical protein
MYGLAVSELGQLGRWCHDALDTGADIDEHSDSVFHASDRAETVPVVGDIGSEWAKVPGAVRSQRLPRPR